MVIPYCNFLRTLRFASLSIFPQRIKTTALWSFCLQFSVMFKCLKGNSIAPFVLSCRYGSSQCFLTSITATFQSGYLYDYLCTQSDECCWRYVRNQIFYNNKDESLMNRPGVTEQIETARSVFCLRKILRQLNNN